MTETPYPLTRIQNPALPDSSRPRSDGYRDWSVVIDARKTITSEKPVPSIW